MTRTLVDTSARSKCFNGNTSSKMCLLYFTLGETVRSHKYKLQVLEKTDFRGVHYREKWFYESFLNGAVSVLRETLYESRKLLDQKMIRYLRYNINRRIRMKDLFAPMRGVDCNKGADVYALRGI